MPGSAGCSSGNAAMPVGASAGYCIESLGVDTQFAPGLEINDGGRVIGQGTTMRPDREWDVFGVVWDPGSGLHDLGRRFFPTTINAEGLVGGWEATGDNAGRAFLWEPDTGVRDIGLPPGWASFTPVKVNGAGQLAGTAGTGAEDEPEPSEAYLWDPVAGWTGFGRSSGVQDLNDAGQLLVNVGGTDEAVYDHHLHLWTPGTPARDLGDGDAGMLNDGGQVAWGRFDEATFRERVLLWDPQTATPTEVVDGRVSGLNDQGQLVGTIESADDPWDLRAYVWSAEDGLTDLGTLPGAEWSTALGINDRGQVVGHSGAGAPGGPDWSHAFVWDPRSGMRDLGTLGASDHSQATAINDAGQIVGISGEPGAVASGVGTIVIWAPASGS